jgi:hypothetical protein
LDITIEQQASRQRRDLLEEALGVKVIRGTSCKCPYHDDKTPSASIRTDRSGVYRFHCFVCNWGGDVFDVRARNQGTDIGNILKEARGMHNIRKDTVFTTLAEATNIRNVEKAYHYTNPDTQRVELVVVRYRDEGNKKKFMQVSPITNGWVRRGPSGKLPLYNLTRVGSAQNVVVVEGEKPVDELAEIGIAATTSPGGAGNAHKADWSPLKGKTVYLWPDNDFEDPKTKKRKGEEHMRDIAKILEPTASRVFWIDQRRLGLPEKGDAVEFLKNNQGSKEDKRVAVQLVLDEAAAIDGVSDLRTRLEAIISGEWANIDYPWYETSAQTQSLLPDTVTALCGDPGAAKSLWILQAFWHWHLGGERTALFMLEDDKTYHMQRVLAQLEQNAELTNADWVRTHGEKQHEHWKINKTYSKRFSALFMMRRTQI